jgi:hypothetical protein
MPAAVATISITPSAVRKHQFTPQRQPVAGRFLVHIDWSLLLVW